MMDSTKIKKLLKSESMEDILLGLEFIKGWKYNELSVFADRTYNTFMVIDNYSIKQFSRRMPSNTDYCVNFVDQAIHLNRLYKKWRS